MVKRNNRGFFAREYKSGWDFIKRIKNYIYFCIFVFSFSVFVGFFFSLPPVIYEKISQILSEIILKTEGLDSFGLMKFIFFNNVQSSFFVFILGFFFGFLPFIFLIFNGIVLGFVAFLSSSSKGFFVLWRIFPHGIFELPAIFISFAMGINLGFWLILNPIKFYWKKKKIVSFLFVLFYLPSFLIAFFADSNFREYMKKGFSDCYDDFIISLKVFVLILIPLLLVGAIIEGFLISILM